MTIEGFPNPKEEELIGFQEATSFDELYDLLNTAEQIKGTRRTYTAAELIKKIEIVRHGQKPLEFITRSHGLRDIVERLLDDDHVFFKYTQGSKAKKY